MHEESCLLNSSKAYSGLILVLALLFLFMNVSGAAAARCQISNVSYDYPHQANSTQQIVFRTTVSGSCVSTGMDYYELRVDVVDMASNSLARNSTPIGYLANNFVVTAEDFVVTPSVNGAWPLQLDVYVIRAGGTSGSFLLDYQTVANVTILVGTTPVPEFNLGLDLTVIASLVIASVLVSSLGVRRRSPA
jgi:hypothetical protein